ncbi:MAG: hypothetical protein ABW321_26375 [Polyangiales bacterium]
MQTSHLITIASLAMAGFGGASVAHASPVKFDNQIAWDFYVMYAEPDASCPQGMRDHLVGLGANEKKTIEVNASGNFYLRAAYPFFGDDGSVVLRSASLPIGRQDPGLWNYVEDGACSDVDWDGPDSVTRGYQWAVYNISNACWESGGVLGVVTRPAGGDGGQPEVATVCFVNGPGDDDTEVPGPGPS